MTKIILNNTEALKSFIKTIEPEVDTVALTFETDALRIDVLNRSHVLFLNFTYDKSFFQTYELSEPTRVLLDTKELNKVLQRSNKNSTLELVLEDAEIHLIFKGEYTKRFTLRVVDEEYTTPQPPQIEYPSIVEVTLNELIESFTDSNLVDTKATLEIVDDQLIIKTNGDFGDYKSELYLTDADAGNILVKSSYTLDYLLLLRNFHKINNTITLKMGDELPLTAVIESVMQDTRVEYLLAPRIEQD